MNGAQANVSALKVFISMKTTITKINITTNLNGSLMRGSYSGVSTNMSANGTLPFGKHTAI